jgi:radical SAM protein with 4Fe4S-binding SPASM domain
MPLLTDIKTFLVEKFKGQPAQAGLTPGIYHFEHDAEAGKSRIHLRVDADGSGLLIVNAARVFHLNPTAVYMAWLVLTQIPVVKAASLITRRYTVSKDQALVDYHTMEKQVHELISPNGACPICELELDTIVPFSARPSAPYRMDLAITYRCNNNCSHCYNARPRQYPEMDTESWKQVLDQLWEASIPHVVFTGGEPTLRPDLAQLIAYAEGKGQIAGINTNGRRLKDAAYLNELVTAGLDHAQITLESHDPAIHDGMVSAQGAWNDTVTGLENALAARNLYVMTNTTLLKSNAPYLAQTLQFLGELGVPTIGLNALIYSGRGQSVGTGLAESDLPPLLELARQSAEKYGQRLIWYTPTQYCHFDPVQMELGVKGCSAALYNMCIEPDGAVIPCQSYYQSLGKMLDTPWEQIWNHPLAVSLRERKGLPVTCHDCALLSECGGGCPLARQNQPELVSTSTLPAGF